MGEISQLLFPERCVACGKHSGLLCKRCAIEWSGRPIKNRLENIPLHSSAYYSSAIARMVIRAKEDNDRRARLVLANAIAAHIDHPSLLVPIPSRKSALRRRGYDHSYLLSKEVARLTGSRSQRILSVNRAIRDQTTVAHDERFTNISGAYSVHPGNVGPEPVVLIDDLVTTGSSMREAIRALKSAGTAPVLLISACIASHRLPNTISPSPSDTWGWAIHE